MGGITLAWLIGEGLIIYRQVSKNHHPPVPGTLLASSALFALLALLAEYQPARGAATLAAFGLDLAAYLQAPIITPKNTPGSKGGPAPTPSGSQPKPIGEV